jgi:cardiolipin synthase
VRVFAFEKRMMHAKFALVDDVWWTLGSANLDELSRSCNLETNVVGMGETEVSQLAQYFDQLLAETRELTFESWNRRPWWQRAVAHGAWHLRSWL